jgi:DNA-binding MarR family transcriptional regulator
MAETSPSGTSPSGAPTRADRVGADGSPLDLADLVSRSARRLRRGSAAHLGPLGLTMAQARVLRSLAGGPLRMAEIAAQLEVVPRTVTPMVDGLEAAGLVRRRTDAADRRSVLVETTDGGRLLLEHLYEARRATAEQVFAPLDREERAQLTALLGRLCGEGCCPPGAAR